MFVKDKELKKKKERTHTHISHILSLLDVALIRRYWKSVLRLEGIVQDVQEANCTRCTRSEFWIVCCRDSVLRHLPLSIFVSFYVLFVLCRPVYCLCAYVYIYVLYYCHRLATPIAVNKYRVSIKSFPDYKHLLQENYV
jgi:hypothetical protein